MISNKPPFSGTRLCINPYWIWHLFAHIQTQEFMFTFMVRILLFLSFMLMILSLLVPTSPTSNSRRSNSWIVGNLGILVKQLKQSKKQVNWLRSSTRWCELLTSIESLIESALEVKLQENQTGVASQFLGLYILA